jgi:hypothetical protein
METIKNCKFQLTSPKKRVVPLLRHTVAMDVRKGEGFGDSAKLLEKMGV